ncbi:hypothetical protein OX284_006030 [Flavobacterium sp. SUN046]|uniref:hypothetical protein n=1 Tax=Flavobacterium sp. SUN046 TaxID=3002440 RepID=UPI002DBE6425|nr:hypothetical protein [Flavobacterium sp. SUN046]MEC4048978.1 hypothetical protein [Flavobacterium sp. SUN046]
MEILNTHEKRKKASTADDAILFARPDVIALGYEVLNYWATKPEIELNWISIQQFSDKIDLIRKLKDSKTYVGKRRQKIMDELILLDREINVNLRFVLMDIENVYRKDAVRFYPFFGIICQNKIFCFPMDQNKRLESLNLLVYALKKHKFDKAPFGLAYWENIQQQYNDLLHNRYSPNFKMPVKSTALMPLKREIYDVFNSLIYAIKANYPHTYIEEREKWGFTKCKY